MNRDPLKTIAPCLFCNYEEFEGAFRRQDRASESFRLSDIAPDLGVPKGHQACFCDNHIQPARKIVMDCGVLEPQKLLEEFNRREANATGQLPGGKE